MASQAKGACLQLHNETISPEQRELLELLLALDRAVVELSMQLYGVSERHQLDMREQNRRLHRVVRAGLSARRFRSAQG